MMDEEVAYGDQVAEDEDGIIYESPMDDDAELRPLLPSKGPSSLVQQHHQSSHVLENMIDPSFTDFLSITTPTLPVQTLFISFHIMQKRARQFIEDSRFFALQQLIWFGLAMLMLLVPLNASRGSRYFAEVYFVIVLVISAAEMFVYIIGHGFFLKDEIQRSAVQLRKLSVLGVWSPPRFRRRGAVGVQQYHLQVPLLSNTFMRVELPLVILSIIGYMLDKDGFGRVRYVHGLRAFRLIYGMANVWPPISRVIATLQASFIGISTALALLLFFFILFGIGGIDQFQNSMSRRCVLQSVASAFDSYNRSSICLDDGTATSVCVEATPPLYCADAEDPSLSNPFVCRGNMVCRTVTAPHYGDTSFADIYHASLLMLQLTSLTDWGSFMYALWASSPRALVGILSSLFVIIVSYVVLNFVVAIICSAYSEHRRSTTARSTTLKSISALNFRLSEFVWWSISDDAKYHLSFKVKGSTRRVPIYEHPTYLLLRDAWLLFLVIGHATNFAGAGSTHTSLLRLLEIINVVFFSLDVLISVVAAGSVGKYLILSTHRFDLFAYVLTILGLGLDIPLSVFRFLLAGHWVEKIPGLKKSKVLQQAVLAAPETLVASMVMLLFMFVSAAVGVQLFSTDVDPVNDWNDSWQSIVTLFRFITLDGWSSVMYDAMAIRGVAIGLGFFLPTYLVFGYIIRGLFTSVVVDAFDPNNEEKIKWQHEMYRGIRKQQQADVLARAQGVGVENELDNDYGVIEERKAIADKSFFYFGINHPVRRILLKIVTVPSELQIPEHVALRDDQSVESLIPYSCYGNYFQAFIILFVLGSCITAADPASEACSQRDAVQAEVYKFTNLVWLDGIFVAVFTIEMIMKMIAHGGMTKGDDRPWYFGLPYFKDLWNLLDIILLIVMYTSFFYPQVSALRLMRILRPLRIIRRFKRMRLLMHGVFRAVPAAFVTLICGAVLLFLFAVVGVAKFKGQMYQCTATEIGDALVITKADCYGMQIESTGVLTHHAWVLLTPNFDTVVDGMSYLLQAVSLSSWTELLSRATSVRGVDLQPQAKSQLQNSLFFFVFVILANNYIVNIIVGVMVASFDEQRGMRYLTLQQRMYKAMKESIEVLNPIPPPPSTRFPRLLRMVRSRWFESLLLLVVFLNVAVLVTTYSGQPPQWTQWQFYLNTTFTFIFLAEAILKILALGRHYFTDMWNDIDFVIVVASMLEFSIQISSSNESVTVTSAGRAFRILRVFRTVRRIPSLHSMFMTLGSSIPAILSIFCVIIMVVFMYAMLGTQMLGQIRFQTAITNDANFRDLLTAWFTVFRMLTLDGWDMMMADASSFVGESCNNGQEGWWYLDEGSGAPTSCGILNDCGNLNTAKFFFFAFYVFSAFIVNCIVIAILLDSFRLNSSSARAVVRQMDIEEFRTFWLTSRKAVGEECFYGLFLEKELMSLLMVNLFKENNGLVLNRRNPDNHVHPVMTSKSRLNFRKIIYELEYIGNQRREQLRKKKLSSESASAKIKQKSERDASSASSSSTTPGGAAQAPRATTPVPGTNSASPFANNEVEDLYPPNKFEFHDVIECLCRFQMGHEALTYDQKIARDAFADKMNVALFGTHIKEVLRERAARARAQVALYNLQELENMPPPPDIRGVTGNPLDDDDPSSYRSKNQEDDTDGTSSGPGSPLQGSFPPPAREGASLEGAPGAMTTELERRNSVFSLQRRGSVGKPLGETTLQANTTTVFRPPVVTDVRSPTLRAGDVKNPLPPTPVPIPATAITTNNNNNSGSKQPGSSAQTTTSGNAEFILVEQESTSRFNVYRESITSLEKMLRKLIEISEDESWEPIPKACKKEWLSLLFAERGRRRLGAGGAYVASSAVVPTAAVPDLRTNPMHHFDAPMIQCPDDEHCDRYFDTSHTAVRRHTCRRGLRCYDRSASHVAQFMHASSRPTRIHVGEISSDDEMAEIRW